MLTRASNRMIPLIHGLSRNIFHCSNANKTVSQKLQALKAVWAENIFNQLAKYYQYEEPIVSFLQKYKLNKQITEKLLKGQPHSGFPTYTQQDIDTAQKQIKSAFDPFQGVSLPDSIASSQQRLAQALNANATTYTFYPNTITTQKIFQRLKFRGKIQILQARDITVGKPGISKTMSYILAWHLSSISAKFRYLNPQLTKYFVDLNIMKQKGLKILYVSFYDGLNIKNYKELIQSQCPQMMIENSQQNKSIKQFLNTILQAYKKKNIDLLGVIDQLNTLARQFANTNQKLHSEKSKQNKPRSEQINQQILKIEQKKKKANTQIQIESIKLEQSELLRKIKRYTKIAEFSNIFRTMKLTVPLVFNSSANIQQKLLGHVNQGAGIYYALDINEHTRAKQIQIQYSKSEIAAKQMYRFFWYQFVKIAQKLDFKVAQIKNIQKQFIQCCDKLSKEKYDIFVTPLAVVQTLPQVVTKQVIQNCLKQPKIIQGVILKIISDKITKKQIQFQKAKKFLFDTNENNKLIKFKIILGAWSFISKNQNSTSIPLSQLNISKNLVQQFHDKDLFRCGKDNLELKISPVQFLQISDRLVHKIISEPQNYQFFHKLNLTHSVLGGILETLITQTIINNQQSMLQTNKEAFSFKGSGRFYNFLKATNPFSKLYQLFNISQKYNNKEYVYYFGYPITSALTKAQNNPSIDFLGIKFNKKLQKFELISFDIGISVDSHQIIQKLTNSFNFINQMLKQTRNFKSTLQQTQFKKYRKRVHSWNHYVICRQYFLQNISNKQKVQQKQQTQIAVQCLPLDQLNVALFGNKQDVTYLPLLNTIREIVLKKNIKR